MEQLVVFHARGLIPSKGMEFSKSTNAMYHTQSSQSLKTLNIDPTKKIKKKANKDKYTIMMQLNQRTLLTDSK